MQSDSSGIFSKRRCYLGQSGRGNNWWGMKMTDPASYPFSNDGILPVPHIYRIIILTLIHHIINPGFTIHHLHHHPKGVWVQPGTGGEQGGRRCDQRQQRRRRWWRRRRGSAPLPCRAAAAAATRLRPSMEQLGACRGSRSGGVPHPRAGRSFHSYSSPNLYYQR